MDIARMYAWKMKQDCNNKTDHLNIVEKKKNDYLLTDYRLDCGLM